MIPEIHIKGVLQSDTSKPDTYSAKMFADDLAAIKGDAVELVINCTGGSVWQGMEIFNAAAASGKKITTRVVGVAASMGSLLMLAGSNRVICKGAMMMIHFPSGSSAGTAAQMASDVEMLKGIGEQMVEIYSGATGMKPEKIREWMSATKWFTAAEAALFGFAHGVDDTGYIPPAPSALAHLSSFGATPTALLISKPTAGAEKPNQKDTTMADETPAVDPAKFEELAAQVAALTAVVQKLVDAQPAEETTEAKAAKAKAAMEADEAAKKDAEAKAKADPIAELRAEVAALRATAASRAEKPPVAKVEKEEPKMSFAESCAADAKRLLGK